MTSQIYQQRPTSFALKPFVEPGKCSEYTLSVLSSQKVLFSDLSSSLKKKKLKVRIKHTTYRGSKSCNSSRSYSQSLQSGCRSRRVCVCVLVEQIVELVAGQDADTHLPQAERCFVSWPDADESRKGNYLCAKTKRYMPFFYITTIIPPCWFFFFFFLSVSWSS